MKYGREDKVQHLLEQYTNFVSRHRIFQEFNKAYIDMQQVVEEYKREGNIGIFIFSKLFSDNLYGCLARKPKVN